MFPPVAPAIDRALLARDYTDPTPVQAAVLGPDAAGRDLLVSARTGSGKTVAYGVALAPELLPDGEHAGPPGKPLVLVVAPTRELAMQVETELAWLYAGTGAVLATCVGGMDARSEARRLQRGAHVVVGTPGRLRDHLTRNQLDLSALRAVVLDEADEMLDLGFREDLTFILDQTPDERRTLLFSATIPHDISVLARTYQRNALRLALQTGKGAARGYRIPRDAGRVGRDRARGRQRAARRGFPRGAGVRRHARGREADARFPRGARLRRGGALR